MKAHELGDPIPAIIRELLVSLGEDPSRPGLAETPERVAASLRHLTEGYELDIDQLVSDALFEQEYDEMVLVRDLPFYSLCEHHLLPFFGTAQVAYIPDGRVLGLSKIARLVDVFAHRLQVQERLTTQVADAIQGVTRARGVGVVMTARHLCMEMRGVEKVGGETVTSCMLGLFRRDPRTRTELLSLIRQA